jgi:arginase family enzyme
MSAGVAMIDPRGRWSAIGEKPDYAGLLTFAGLPYTEDAADLAGVDVAIVGVAMDDLFSDRPGTSFAPRAIRAASSPPGPHLEAGVDAFEELRVVDFGDAAVMPGDARRSHAAIEAVVREVLAAGSMSWSSAATTRSPSRA